MGNLGAMVAMVSLAFGQGIPVSHYVSKDVKFAGSYLLKDLPKEYHAYSLNTGDRSIVEMLPMLFQSGPLSEPVKDRLMDLCTISYTKGDTVVFEGTDYLVAYIPNLTNFVGAGTGDLPEMKLALTFIRKDRIISYGPREDLNPDMLQLTESKSANQPPSEEKSLSNMKQLGLGFALYASDSDDLIPATDSTADAQEVTFPYIEKAQLWQTQNPVGGRILFNTKIAGMTVRSFKNAAETVLLFDEKPWPDGRRGVCFVDGHVAFISDPEFRRRMSIVLPPAPHKMIRISGKRMFPTTAIKENPARPPATWQ